MFLKNHIKINPHGDGNCLFNAVTLGMGDLILSGALDSHAATGKYAQFITKCHKELGIDESWQGIKQFFQANSHDLLLIQLKLAQVLRKLVGDLFKKNPKPTKGHLATFQAEFQDHLLNHFQLERDEKFRGGDIFSQHSQFTTEFEKNSKLIEKDLQHIPQFKMEELRLARLHRNKKLPLSAQEKVCLELFEATQQKHIPQLVEWFEGEGYSTFLDQMQNSGTWAGDMELKELGAYFHIDFMAHNSDDFQTYLHSFHGDIAKENINNNQIAQLIQREIIDADTSAGKLYLRKLDEATLDRKLEMVPNNGDIASDWIEQGDNNRKKIADQIVHSKSLSYLEERGVATFDQQEKCYYYRDLDLDSLLSRLVAIEDADAFKKLWRAAYITQPVIVLSNPEAYHWFYFQPPGMKWDLSSIAISRFQQTKDTALKTHLNDSNTILTNWGNLNTTPIQVSTLTQRMSKIYPSQSFDEVDVENILKEQQEEYAVLLRISNEPNDSDDSDSPGYDISFDELSPQPFSTSIPKSHPTLRELSDLIEIPSYPPSMFFTASTNRTLLPSSPSTSPPHKKTKILERNAALADAAENARDKLAKLHSSHPVIQELIDAFRYALTSGEIGRKHGCLLAIPRKYAEIKGILLTEPLPSEVEKFTSAYTCEIFLQAQRDFHQQFSNCYIWLTSSSIKKTEKTLAIIDTLKKIYKQIHATNFSVDKLKEKIQNIKPNLFEELDEQFQLIHEPIIKQNLKDLKECVQGYQHLLLHLTPQASAKSILYLLDESQSKLTIYRELFNLVQDHGFSELSYMDINQLLEFTASSFPNEIALSKAINAFTELFISQLLTLKDLFEMQNISEYTSKI